MKRWITTAIGLLLTAAPLGFFAAAPLLIFGAQPYDVKSHTEWRFLGELASCYAAPIVAGTWLFKFPTRPTKSPTPPISPL